MIEYLIEFRIDLGKAIAPVGELANELNGHLARMGCDEKLAITSKFPALSLQVSREFTPEEFVKAKKLIESQFQSAFPKWDLQLTSFYRKPHKPEQSAKQ